MFQYSIHNILQELILLLFFGDIVLDFLILLTY